MAEVEVQDQTGRVWGASEFALEKGHLFNETEFAQILNQKFRVHSYERMQELWQLRDRCLRSNRSGTYPEGADISGEFR